MLADLISTAAGAALGVSLGLGAAVAMTRRQARRMAPLRLPVDLPGVSPQGDLLAAVEALTAQVAAMAQRLDDMRHQGITAQRAAVLRAREHRRATEAALATAELERQSLAARREALTP